MHLYSLYICIVVQGESLRAVDIFYFMKEFLLLRFKGRSATSIIIVQWVTST